MQRTVRATLALLTLAAVASVPGCGARRSPGATPPASPAATAAEEEAEGPPRPPTLDELQKIGDVPAGRASIQSLPGGNQRVNQDSSGAAQNETTIVASPADPNVLVGAWNDYFAVNPGQNTVIGYGWSSDGGLTWQSSRVDFSSLPSSQSTGDPALAADSQGNVYLGVLAYNGTAPGILVAKSTDGGVTFAEPVRLDNGGDKEFLTVDTATDDVYVVWENGSAVGQAIYFSKSTDGGASFTPRVQISNGQSTGNGAYPAVGPSGEIYVLWSNFSSRLYFDRSLDGGTTWLATDVVAVQNIVKARDPLAGGFRNPLIPAIACDRSDGPYRGRIYAVWEDQRFGDPDILISWSDDRGDSWSAPARVNDDAPGNDADQFFPWVAVDDAGQVHVTFLDRRDDDAGMLFSMTLATSSDGGVTFGPNVRISDGLYGPSNFGFLGDYTGAAVSAASRIHPLWPDGRNGDEDVFSAAVDLVDYDGDGVLNDGDGDGIYAGTRCTGGQTAGCDDNCPGAANAGQGDADGDLVGDACDNCPNDPNTDQYDVDRDGLGDACDACPGQPGGDGSDPDLDGVANCVDNCPAVANADQADADGDGLGDACDVCPADPQNDADGDGLCGGADNCPAAFNPAQGDSDGDGVGDRCDDCPVASDAAQIDSDGDGAGDACDCEPADPGDREPPEVGSLGATRGAAGSTELTWTATAGSDAYSVRRGDVASLPGGGFGDCVAEGLDATTWSDADLPAAGQALFYLVQAQSFDCGLGPLGYGPEDVPRDGSGPGACLGATHADTAASGESAVAGTVTGSYVDTHGSDDVSESITEEISSGGPPTQRYAFLEQRFTFDVPAASRVELHVEGSRTAAQTGNDFAFEYSTDGGATWNPTGLPSLPVGSDGDRDLQAALPPGVSGTVVVRVVDLNRSAGALGQDTVSIDDMFIRTVP